MLTSDQLSGLGSTLGTLAYLRRRIIGW